MKNASVTIGGFEIIMRAAKSAVCNYRKLAVALAEINRMAEWYRPVIEYRRGADVKSRWGFRRHDARWIPRVLLARPWAILWDAFGVVDCRFRLRLSSRGEVRSVAVEL